MSRFRNVIALTLSAASVVWGQNAGAKPPTDPVKAPPAAATGQAMTVDATRKQALRLLDQLLEMAGEFGDPETRIQVQARIADALWEHDKSRAGGLMTSAFRAIAETALPAIDHERPPSYVGADSHLPLRSELLRMIAQRDSALAVKLVETVVDQPPNVDPKFLGSGYGQYSEQRLLYNQIADSVARSDTAGAARFARTFIDKGDLQLALRVIESLPENADLATDLFAQVIAAARRDKERAGSNMRSLADIVFPRFGEGTLRFTSGDSDPRSANPRSPGLVEPFLDFAFEVITDQIKSLKPGDAEPKLSGPQSTDFTVARLLMPYFERYMPDKAGILRPRIDEVVHVAAASARASGEFRRAPELLTAQELVEAAEATENSQRRDMMYLEVATRAARGGEIDQVNEIANRITDAHLRASVELHLRSMEEAKRSQAVLDSMRRGDFDNTLRLINQNSNLRRRISELGNLAVSLLAKHENVRAGEVITEAQRLIPNTENAIDRVSDQLRLAGLASRLDVDRGFDDLRMAVVAMNSAKLVSQWSRMEQGAAGTPLRTEVGLKRLGFAFDAGFGPFGRADFDRALAAARSIEMKEASVLAQLAVCRAVLSTKR